jgi:hypothetical protein
MQNHEIENPVRREWRQKLGEPGADECATRFEACAIAIFHARQMPGTQNIANHSTMLA